MFKCIFPAIFALLLAVGCGDGITRPAGGTVSVGGKPVDGGLVVFYPTDGGRSGSGKIEPDGSFVISYLKMGDGMPPGNYVVTLLSDKVRGEKKQVDTEEELMVNATTKLTHIVPVKYNNRATTPLKVTVSDDGEPQYFKFEIDSES